ncbi:MAG: MMPL family transporter, partial [Chitinophagales bacterium]|nr:MMPL family transporter [Chitinophagales bacterium]
MIWRSIAKIILRNRLVFLIVWILLTAFMTYETTRVKLSYDFYKTVPEDNQAYIDYENFKKIFGDEGNIMFMAVQTDKFWNLDFFRQWYELENALKEIPDVESVYSVSSAVTLVKNTEEKKFDAHPLIVDFPKTQAELDSIKEEFFALPFYKNRIYNADSNTYVMLLALDKDVLNSVRRIDLIEDIQEKTEAFAEQQQVDLKYSGLPFIRYYQLTTITSEVRLFLILAVLVTILTLYFLFRSIDAVVFPLLIIGSGVVISTGMMALMGYKLTVLTSLIPSLLIIMGIPNCVYLLNKYHMEFRRHGNKIKALSETIEKVGFATLVTNAT